MNDGDQGGIGEGNAGIVLGMSLRDYFAAAAMTGLLVTDLHMEMSEHSVAATAYSQADAMLAEREKQADASGSDK